LPALLRHKVLKRMASGEVGAERVLAVGHRKLQGCTSVPKPQLGGITAVPMADLAFGQQEEDGGASAATAVRRWVPPGLAVMAAFGMRGELQRANDCSGRQRWVAEVDQVGSRGMVWAMPGSFAMASNIAVSPSVG